MYNAMFFNYKIVYPNLYKKCEKTKMEKKNE